jgi:phosphoglucosamine mutase
VILTGPLPTPGVAFVTKSMRGIAGVMISASHNSYEDNGIKIFDANGYKLADEIELILEDLIEHPEKMEVKTNSHLGNAKRIREVAGRYVVQCKNALSDQFDLEGIRIVLDCANGAGYKVAPMVFKELGGEVFPLGIGPNGTNINFECGSLHPEKTQELVSQLRADIGICLDGDADRCVIVNEEGQVVPGDVLIGCFAKLLFDQGILKEGHTVVGTIMSNLGLERYLEGLGLKFLRTQVGDRYIMEAMREHHYILGGEPSGHIIFRHHATTGDGAMAALKMIECMRYSGKSVKELTRLFKLYPQVLKNVNVTSKPPLEDVLPIQKELQSVQKKLGKKGRVVLRYSGTEDKIRVMVEGENEKQVSEVCDHFSKVVATHLS